MNAILTFFGRMLNGLYTSANGLFPVLLYFTLIFKAMFLLLSNKYYKSIKLAETLQPQIDKINKKYEKNPEKRSKAVTELLIKSGYSTFGFMASFIFQTIVGVFLAITIKNYLLYIPLAAGSDVSLLFLENITDFTFRNIQMLAPSTDLLKYLLLPAVACVLQYFHDKFMREHSLVERTNIDYILLGITLVLTIILPQAYSIFWIASTLINMLLILYYAKFANTKPINIEALEESNKAKEKNKAK